MRLLSQRAWRYETGKPRVAPGSIHLEKRYISQAKVVRLRLPARYVVGEGNPRVLPRDAVNGPPAMSNLLLTIVGC